MIAYHSYYLRKLRYLLLLTIGLMTIVTIFMNSNILIKKTEFIPSIAELKSTKLNNISQCYFSTAKHADAIKYFEDILDAKKQPTPGKAIFFHETGCSRSGIIKLNAK